MEPFESFGRCKLSAQKYETLLRSMSDLKTFPPWWIIQDIIREWWTFGWVWAWISAIQVSTETCWTISSPPFTLIIHIYMKLCCFSLWQSYNFLDLSLSKQRGQLIIPATCGRCFYPDGFSHTLCCSRCQTKVILCYSVSYVNAVCCTQGSQRTAASSMCKESSICQSSLGETIVFVHTHLPKLVHRCHWRDGGAAKWVLHGWRVTTTALWPCRNISPDGTRTGRAEFPLFIPPPQNQVHKDWILVWWKANCGSDAGAEIVPRRGRLAK